MIVGGRGQYTEWSKLTMARAGQDKYEDQQVADLRLRLHDVEMLGETLCVISNDHYDTMIQSQAN